MSTLGKGLAACALFVSIGVHSAEPGPSSVAVATIVDGEAQLVHGTQKFALAEGVRVAPGDIIQTDATTRLVRVEFGADDGIVNLGPSTQVLIGPHFIGAGDRPTSLYLMQGWVKTSEPVASATLDDVSVTGKCVIKLSDDGAAQVFSESGTTVLADRAGGDKTVTLKAGDFFQRAASDAGQTLSGPSSNFIAQVPRPFVDTLPARADLFKDRIVEPNLLGVVTYEDVQPWLDAESALRRSYVARWMPLTHDVVFRKLLVEHLASHREWEPILFPRRYDRQQAAR